MRGVFPFGVAAFLAVVAWPCLASSPSATVIDQARFDDAFRRQWSELYDGFPFDREYGRDRGLTELDRFLSGRAIWHRYITGDPAGNRHSGNRGQKLTDYTFLLTTAAASGSQFEGLNDLIACYCQLEDLGLPIRRVIGVEKAPSVDARFYGLFWKGSGDREWAAFAREFSSLTKSNDICGYLILLAFVPRQYVERSLELLRGYRSRMDGLGAEMYQEAEPMLAFRLRELKEGRRYMGRELPADKR